MAGFKPAVGKKDGAADLGYQLVKKVHVMFSGKRVLKHFKSYRNAILKLKRNGNKMFQIPFKVRAGQVKGNSFLGNHYPTLIKVYKQFIIER